ncbi:MAG: signal peptidase I [Treponema sp.]|jgi:signal peptidase I|nr:signal peptidase I [Treponema sp.]
MFDKWRKYSYASQKNQRHHLLWIFLFFLVLFFLYNLLTSFVFSLWVLENDTMQPGLSSGDRLIFSSFAIPSLLAGIEILNPSLPFRRGNIVLVDMDGGEKKKMPLVIADGLIRFFTAQRISLFGNEERFYVKRLVGLPGDEIVMTNFILRVRPAGDSYSLTEFELSDKPYDVNIPQVPALWNEVIPFSGNMSRIVLGEDECFVISDDRSNTNDSRTWGPISADLIRGRALFRYWPLTKLGRP